MQTDPGAENVRTLKDAAIAAVEGRHYPKAASLYLRISNHEPSEPRWHQRAGEALRKANLLVGAAAEFAIAALSYADNGFSPQAIALARLAIRLDPANRIATELLFRLT